MVCVRVNLDFVGMLISRIGGGSGVGFRPFVVHPPSCRGGRFHTTKVTMLPSVDLLYWAIESIQGTGSLR